MLQLFDSSIWDDVIDTMWDRHLHYGNLCPLSFPENREEIAVQLITGQYRFDPPHLTKIPKDDGTLRSLLVLSPQDRIVMQAIYKVYYDLVKQHIHPSCRSYQTGVSLQRTVLDTQHAFQRCQTGYRLDISKYFDKVPIEIIDSIFDKYFPDNGVTKCLREFYHDNHIYIKNILTPYYKSLCQGCSFSSLLANLTLKDLDIYCANNATFYVRYSDDILVLDENAEQHVDTIKSILSSKGLTLSEHKTLHITPDISYFTFLGVNISKDSLSMAKKSREHFKTGLKKRLDKLATKKFKTKESYLRKAIQVTYQYLASSDSHEYAVLNWWFSLKVNASDIVWLEQQCKDMIRSKYTGKHNTTHNLHVFPNELFKQCGWHTLQHLYNLYKCDKHAFNVYLRYLGYQHIFSSNTRIYKPLETLCSELNSLWEAAKFADNHIFIRRLKSTEHQLIQQSLVNYAFIMMVNLIRTTSTDFGDKYFINLNNGLIIFKDWFES